MNELALFAGAGGGLLGTKILGWRTVCAVEFNPYRRKVLLQRQRDGMLDLFPIWDDVRTFDGWPWHGIVDVVSAGFPCQPFSSAGRMLGSKDGRNMWPETIRIIREVRPPMVWLENVPGLRSSKKARQRMLKGFPPKKLPAYLGTVLGQLAESGYDAAWDCVPASFVRANHIRDRIWILAYAAIKGERSVPAGRRPGRQRKANAHSDCQVDGSNAHKEPVEGRSPQGAVHRTTETAAALLSGTASGDWWASEPHVDRVGYGLASRVDRTEAIGDGQVPAVVRAAWEILTKGSVLNANNS